MRRKESRGNGKEVTCNDEEPNEIWRLESFAANLIHSISIPLVSKRPAAVDKWWGEHGARSRRSFSIIETLGMCASNQSGPCHPFHKISS